MWESLSTPMTHCFHRRWLSCNSVVLLLFFLFFNWRKIALQCYVGFCHTTMQFSHTITHVTSLLSLPPLPQPHPFKSSQSARLGSLCCVATSHQLSVLHMVVYVCLCCFLHSTLSSPTVSISLFSISMSPFLPCKYELEGWGGGRAGRLRREVINV